MIFSTRLAIKLRYAGSNVPQWVGPINWTVSGMLVVKRISPQAWKALTYTVTYLYVKSKANGFWVCSLLVYVPFCIIGRFFPFFAVKVLKTVDGIASFEDLTVLLFNLPTIVSVYKTCL